MIRKTFVVPAALSIDWHFQKQVSNFWDLIENNFEEEWHVQANGDLILTVDDAMLERILSDNVARAWFDHGSFGGGQTAEGKRYFLRRPESLKGEYIIKGVYDASQRLVNGERTYFFVQGA